MRKKRINIMRILTIFNFATGDASCTYWQEYAVVYGTLRDMRELEDSVSSFLDTPESEDLEYRDIVIKVLSASSLGWELPSYIPECDTMYSLWL
jgi:hypothetical protein